MAKMRAEEVLRAEGINSLPVDLFLIAKNHEILIRAKPDCAYGVSGMLLRHGDTFGILFATHINNEGFQRFCIAHELGHYFLEGHIDQVLKSAHASNAGHFSSDPYEQEADSFASSLLMPAIPFRKSVGKFAEGLQAVIGLANLCGTSLSATAIRYAELTEDAVAVIVSTGQKVDYAVLSDLMKKSLPGLSWPVKGSKISGRTLTSTFNENSARVLSADQDVIPDTDIQEWLGGDHSSPAMEEVIGLGSYGKTLTVLTCLSLQDETYKDDDEEDEDSLIDSWTPRFHKR